MAWYRVNTCSLTSGSPAVNGASTAWVANAQAGDAFKGPDEKLYEVQSVNSDTSITLASNYLGATAALQAYAIIPTQGRVRDLSAQVLALINDFGAVVTGAGAGRFGDGTVSAPGVSFASDPDCGWYRIGANNIGLVTGGVLRLNADANGLIAVGGTPNSGLFAAVVAGLQAHSTSIPAGLAAYQADGTKNLRVAMFADAAGSLVGWDASYSTGLTGYAWKVANSTKMLLDIGGSLGIGIVAPGAKLHVAGTFRQTDATNSTGYTANTATAKTTIAAVSAGGYFAWQVNNSAVDSLTLDGAGNVGIGTAAPAQKLHVVGPSAVGAYAVIVEGGQAGYGAGISFQSRLGTSGALAEMGRLVWDGEAVWSSTDANTQDSHMRIFVARNGSLLEAVKVTSDGSLIQRAPTAPPSLEFANQVVLNMTSNTNLRISGRGSDGVTRVGNITLA